MQTLRAERYSGIQDRSLNVDELRKELQVIIDAAPTTINPEERTKYLDAILHDLEDRDDASWTTWPPSLVSLALTAIKTLARNPIGSTTLLTPPHLQTILFHSALPFSLASRSESSPYSKISGFRGETTSPQALEALKVVANLLVLHSEARDAFAHAGGGKAIARALASVDAEGKKTVDDFTEKQEAARAEWVFLIGRIGFLVTLDRSEVVEEMVDQEGLIDSLVFWLRSTAPTASNFMALTELFKMIINVIRFYPFSSASSSTDSSDSWDVKLDPLLAPTLSIFHTLPLSDLVPPLSTAMHVLLAIPFLPRLLSTWTSVPASLSTSTSTESASQFEARDLATTLPPSLQDPLAFPQRIISILQNLFNQHLPGTTEPESVRNGIALDEILPPVLLLLARAAEAVQETRMWLRETLLPSGLDRSTAAGPLEKRAGPLGNLLRFMARATYPQTRDTAGELLWIICDCDASTLTAEIGYGNAAGLLFQKGISGPPPGKIEAIVEPTNLNDLEPSLNAASSSKQPLHPITALQSDAGSPDPMAGMTDAEKEHEAERLFALFDKMERNPVISTQGPDGKQQPLGEVMKDKYVEVDREWGDKEREREEEEERKDEEEVAKEMDEYRKRIGR